MGKGPITKNKIKFDCESTATTIIVDSSILQHVLEILNIMIREDFKLRK